MESSLSLWHWNIQWDLRNFRDFEWLFIHNKPMVIMVILNPLTINGFLSQPCQTGSRTSALVVWSCQSPSLAAILTFDNWSWWQTSPHQTRLIKDPGVNWHRYGKSTICTEKKLGKLWMFHIYFGSPRLVLSRIASMACDLLLQLWWLVGWTIHKMVK